MITRIFRVLIHEECVPEFEKAFKEVAIPLVKAQKGLVSFIASKPITDKNLEYLMLTNWESMEALQQFVGKDWQAALIPKGMEKYIKQCWLHHYESVEIS